MKLLKSPIVIGIVAFIAGVMMADTAKPMLGKLPVIGKMINKDGGEEA